VCDRGSELSVGGNKLEGSIPDFHAWGLTKLQCVRLLRVSMCHVKRADRFIHCAARRVSRELYLSENTFEGQIPDGIGNLESLRCMSVVGDVVASLR
jgi:hypothetical protein